MMGFLFLSATIAFIYIYSVGRCFYAKLLINMVEFNASKTVLKEPVYA